MNKLTHIPAFLTLALTVCASIPARGAVEPAIAAPKGSVAQLPANGNNTLPVTLLDVARTDDNIFVKLSVDPTDTRMNSNREVIYTPMLVAGQDTVRLPQFILAGRNRYYRLLRNGHGDDPRLMRAGHVDQTIDYSVDAPWQDWMAKATLAFEAETRGCCGASQSETVTLPVAEVDFSVSTLTTDEVDYHYVAPEAEAVKRRSVTLSAYVDFPVSQTVIRPAYRRNGDELARISATIDSVRADSDVTVTSIHVRGYASPEGTWDTNERLAKGRTEALSRYVRGLYPFEGVDFTTDYVVEDWEGLQNAIVSLRPGEAPEVSDNKEGILALIASVEDPDRREAEIKRAYPRAYAWLKANVYPALRHSDYTVAYTVRRYDTPAEVISVMQTAPQNLSLYELYAAAQSVGEETPEANEAFDLSVQMHPEDPTANLNAAMALMRRGQAAEASRYLAKAGGSPEARYARAINKGLLGDKEGALRDLRAIDAPAGSPLAASIERECLLLERLIADDSRHFRML